MNAEEKNLAVVQAVDSSSLSAQAPGYGDFLVEIKSQIRQRQFQALRAANRELLALYWWLGENISQRQAALGWGKGVVENLARDLQVEFPGRNGFSAQNLWLMRQFFNEYSDKPKLQSLIGEISWAKNLLVMARCKGDLEREFYLRATARFGWTTNVLRHQIDNHSYAQYLNGQTNFDAAVPDTIKAQALLAVKDHYTFDFLGLAEEHSERELEQALVRNLRGFLSEMGGAFTFVGNQYRLEVDGKEYFIDLLLFHRRLRCLVAIELKIGDFKPEHKGQIEFYLDTLDQQHRLEGENPPIGIVICRSKTKTMVEYALRTMTRPLGIATYTVTPQLPVSYRNDLPSPEQIAARLQGWAASGEDGEA
ncbi:MULTISPECIES: YhcG family protein [unclassified Polaromonas]|uniref:PDDEXK nuclease domain-containing protein n=1 Tax=unclassified Polaromonas TaxID=2638319 RepID=UPI0018C99D69|nr:MULTISPECIES: PDDEXK nuclease domain-containing protein [unclassified Polaromonas]MBG6071582.1 putative nuclease of restriction endonuclease-like (RecB) superfamily [Polaromonas sp. CG_9.7]MBG6113583.1 putative nuclease of restriction endonuclease-like (RecB) superfamily [Polaromonas sp. CG_9.2]